TNILCHRKQRARSALPGHWTIVSKMRPQCAESLLPEPFGASVVALKFLYQIAEHALALPKQKNSQTRRFAIPHITPFARRDLPTSPRAHRVSVSTQRSPGALRENIVSTALPALAWDRQTRMRRSPSLPTGPECDTAPQLSPDAGSVSQFPDGLARHKRFSRAAAWPTIRSAQTRPRTRAKPYDLHSRAYTSIESMKLFAEIVFIDPEPLQFRFER